MFDYVGYIKEVKQLGNCWVDEEDYDRERAKIDKEYKVIYRESTDGGLLRKESTILILDEPVDNYIELTISFYEDDDISIYECEEIGHHDYTIPAWRIEELKEMIHNLPKTMKNYQMPIGELVCDGWGKRFSFYDYESGRTIHLWTTNEDHLTWIYNIMQLKEAYNCEGERFWERVIFYGKKGFKKDFEWYEYHSRAIAKPLRYIHRIEKFFGNY